MKISYEEIIPVGYGLTEDIYPILFVYNNTMLCENKFYENGLNANIMKLCFLTDKPFLTNAYNVSVVHANILNLLLEDSLWGFSEKEIEIFKSESCVNNPQINHIYKYKYNSYLMNILEKLSHSVLVLVNMLIN